jgi:DNA/RNA non-specific endonuclease
LHPFWSLDRCIWVPMNELHEGERVTSNNGPLRIQQIVDTGETEPVYNLEVEGDPCYRVGQQGVLVHNNSVEDFCPWKDEPGNKVGKKPQYTYDNTEVKDGEKGRWVTYDSKGEIASSTYYPGRPKGFRIIVAPSGPKGSGTDKSLLPPGWIVGLNKDGNYPIARGHLVARSLGGKGDIIENIATFCQRTTNLKWHAQIEKEIRERLSKGWTTYYEVELEYDGNSGFPRRIKYRACGCDPNDKQTGLWSTTKEEWTSGIVQDGTAMNCPDFSTKPDEGGR